MAQILEAHGIQNFLSRLLLSSSLPNVTAVIVGMSRDLIFICLSDGHTLWVTPGLDTACGLGLGLNSWSHIISGPSCQALRPGCGSSIYPALCLRTMNLALQQRMSDSRKASKTLLDKASRQLSRDTPHLPGIQLTLWEGAAVLPVALLLFSNVPREQQKYSKLL